MIVQCEQCLAKFRLDDSRIPAEKAKVKCSRCQHIFMVSKETPPQEEPTVQLYLEEQHEKATQDLFQCPNCGFQQPPSQDCIKCGIVFSKFRERPETTPSPYAQYPEVYGEGGDLFQDQVEQSPMVFAGFWARFGAYVIDSVIAGIIVKISMYLVMFPISYYVSSHAMSGTNPQLGLLISTLPIAVLIAMLPGTLYFIIMWGSKGATLGKMAMKLKIVGPNGSDISYGTAFLRYIGSIISGIPLSLGYLWMLWDDKRQTWHDKMASTYVIRTQ
jgi:predicted Zn finger-like uncharacterized protein